MAGINVFEVYGKLGLDTGEYEKALGNSERKTSDFASKLKSGFKTAAKVGAAAITTIGTGLGAMAKIGWEYNAQIESYTTDFATMMGDAEAAAAKVEELKKLGAKTPFELGDLANATKTLLAFNVSADESSNVLNQLGDISLGNVQKLESLTRAYGKMNASQKVSLEDINMMIDAGFNPLLIVAENTGETMTEVYKRISAGKVSFEEIQGAIQQATSEGGQFFQGMDKASQTTNGLISTLKDNVQSKIGELFEGLSEKGQEMLPKIIDFVDAIDTDAIIQGLSDAKDMFEDILPVIGGATGAFVAYKAATSISGVIDMLRKATEGQTVAQTLLNAVMNANPFVLVASLIAGVGTALVTLYMTNEDFRNKVKEIWGKVKDTFKDAVGFIGEKIHNLVEWTQSIPEKFKELGKNIVDGLKQGISNAWNNLKEWFTSLFGDLTGIAKKILGIASPSKVFKSYGKFIDEGLALGISQNANIPNDAIEKLAQGVTNEFDVGVSTVPKSNYAATTTGGVSRTDELLMELVAMFSTGTANMNVANPRDMRVVTYG